ncbi:MAG: hypothetical protein FJX23_06550 [Alphaproteobacteria bacterium]|nr:hypothetical protein [Alphaproteobacteria bacterium]
MGVEKLIGNVQNFGDFSSKNAQKTQENDANFADFLVEAKDVKARSEEIIAEHNALHAPSVPDAKAEFKEFMSKDSSERLREQVLLALGITEEDLAAMSPEERMKVEMKIAAIIEEKIRMATEEQLEKSAVAAAGGDVDADATVQEAAEAQADIALSSDEARKDDWLAALGLPQDGRVQVGFTAYGDLKMTGHNPLATAGAEEIL